MPTGAGSEGTENSGAKREAVEMFRASEATGIAHGRPEGQFAQRTYGSVRTSHVRGSMARSLIALTSAFFVVYGLAFVFAPESMSAIVTGS